MGFVAELCYLLWWKKKRTSSTSNTTKIQDFSSLVFCWRRPSSFNSGDINQEHTNSVRNPLEQDDLEMGSSKNLGAKSYGEEGVEAELMRMHNLCGPPRFLFTIMEESKEDLESEDGKSRGSSRKGSRSHKSLSDFLSPLSSPAVRASSILGDTYNHHGFNPLFEAEVSRFGSSPPPKFKFLRDAEEKLMRRLLMEDAERKRGLKNEGSVHESAIRDVSIVRLSNQVLPLASSPTFRPVLDEK